MARRALLFRMFLCAALTLWTSVGAEVLFLRGDFDHDGQLNITDCIRVFRYLFLGDRDPVLCEDAADADDDGIVLVTDGIYLLNYLFLGGDPPPFPSPHCGPDPTEDSLGCEQFWPCRPAFSFFGEDFAGDGVFFVIDRSTDMLGRGELMQAKRETSHVISTSREETEFGIVFVAGDIRKYPATAQPAGASEESKHEALTFIYNTPGGGEGSCMRAGLSEALQFAELSTTERRVLFYMGAGGGACGDEEEESYLRNTVDQITSENRQRVQINCIGLLIRGRTMREDYLRELAVRNGGVYVPID